MGREDYPKFAQLTGIRTADQFRAVFGAHDDGAINSVAQLALSAVGDPLKVKIQCVTRLVEDWQQPEGRAVSHLDGR
jgi:hypothetical protein